MSTERKKGAPPMTNEMKFELQKLNRLEESGAEIEKKLSQEDIDRADYVLSQKRTGPKLLKMGLSAGTGFVAFTYLMGFFHLYRKDRPSWARSWRFRVMTLGPMMSAFFAGNGVFPVPYQKDVEEYLGRTSITMVDIIKAHQVKERQLLEQGISQE